jgi:RNA polymerase sigma-70 factor (ECF subfamily)
VELHRQLEKHKAKTHHSDVYKRRARREEARRQKLEAIPVEERRTELLSALMEDHLPTLYNFVRREIAYHVSMGDLPPDRLTPEDVVAAVAMRAQRQFVKKPESRDIRGWLIQLALDEIEGEVRRSHAEETLAPIEADIPEAPPQPAVSTFGDELLDFWQPDEDLKVDDTTPAPAPTPEEILASCELEEYLARTLAGLPPAWRRAFVLRYVEDFPVPEIAGILGTTAQQVESDLVRARSALAQRLIQAGIASGNQNVARVFGMAADADVPDSVRGAVGDKLGRPQEAGVRRPPAS